jgi:hypothetical protein
MSAADHSDLRSSLVDDEGLTVPQSERQPPLDGDGTPYGVKAPDEERIATARERDGGP